MLNFEAVLSQPVLRHHSAMNKILKNLDEATVIFVGAKIMMTKKNIPLQSIKYSIEATAIDMQNNVAELEDESDGMSDTS